jgi:uncharacterized tellurite resistance protein B-like protein
MAEELKSLTKKQRLLLLEFVCAFAWADLEIRDEERAFIARLVKRLELEDDEIAQVEQWLRIPPKPEDIDPNLVPHAHKELFLDCARRMIKADGRVDPAERETLQLLEQLI